MHPELTDRESIKDLLFNILKAVHRFEQYEVNKYGLTFQQIYLLKLLNKASGLTISEIATDMRMKIFSATRLVDQLEGKNLVDRKKSKTDRRSVLVSLNKKGLGLIKKIDDNALDTIISNISGFSEKEIDAFFVTSEHFEQILSVEEPNGDQ